MGALLGDEVVYGGPATWSSSRATSGTRSGTRATSRAASSRSSPPAASSTTSRSSSTHPGPLGPRGQPVADRYGLELDFEGIPGLCERFGVTFGG